MKAKLLGILILALLPVLAFATVASAQTFRSGENTNIAANETIDGSAWLAGSNIDVAGNINGDLFCAGQNITISGNIDGDVICAGQTVTFSGTVTGDVRLAGQTVTVSGDVDGSVSSAGQTVTLEDRAAVGRDASFAGQSITVNGPIFRDLAIASNSAGIGSRVGRNVTATVGSLTLNSDADIKGGVNYTSPQKLTMSSGAQVDGTVAYTESKHDNQQAAGYSFTGILLWSLMLIVSALIFALIFPRELHTTTDEAIASPMNALLAVLVGLVAGIIVPVILIILMITILGIPFAIVALLAWLLILAVSGAFAAYYVGRVVMRRQTNAVLIMLVGAVIVTIALMIPILNVLVWFLAVWFGSGVILLHLKDHMARPHYEMKKAPAHSHAK
jgi:cytoskeletal protein CcmA (bactofilin family)